MQAVSPEEKAHAIQEGAQRVLKTLDWLKRHRCMPPAQLKEWQHMVRWQGSDTQGWPILVIKIAKACAECQGSAAEAVAEAIISQVQLRRSHHMSSCGSCPSPMAGLRPDALMWASGGVRRCSAR